MKTRLILKKGNLSSGKDALAYIFYFVQHEKGQGTNFKGQVGLLTIFECISIGPIKSLETNISQKGYLPGDKRFWPFFSSIFACDEPPGTINGNLQGFVTITGEDITSVPLDLGDC